MATSYPSLRPKQEERVALLGVSNYADQVQQDESSDAPNRELHRLSLGGFRAPGKGCSLFPTSAGISLEISALGGLGTTRKQENSAGVIGRDPVGKTIPKFGTI